MARMSVRHAASLTPLSGAAPVMYGRAPPRVASRRGSTATILPPYITAMRSESASTLGEIRRDEQDRLAGVARLAQPRVDELDRADVDAARRLRGEQHLEGARPSRAR